MNDYAFNDRTFPMDSNGDGKGEVMTDLASHLARKIFEAGDERDDRTQRIQFRGGCSRDLRKETDLGGLCESALAECIRQALKERGVPL